MNKPALSAMLLALLCACGSGGPKGALELSPSSPRNQLELGRQGLELRLDGTPLKPAYQALYPNPERVDHLMVTFNPDGTWTSRCTVGKADAPCGDTPFVTHTVATRNGGTQVRVWDIFGEPVAVFDFTQGGQQDPGLDPAGGDGSPYPDDGASPDDPGTDTPPPTTEDPGSDVPAGDGDVCSLPSIEAEYCAQINAKIAALGLTYHYDCKEVVEAGEEWPNPAMGGFPLPSGPGLGTTIPCHDVIPMAYRGACGDIHTQMTVSNWYARVMWRLVEDGICLPSPLVLDLDGDGVQLSSLEGGVSFDLLAKGSAGQCAWVTGQDALLAMDRNGNGVIDDASELFGNFTGGRSYSDGFAALSELDTNHDHLIDRRDSAFTRLRLWVDRQRDGRSSKRELTSLSASGIRALDLNAARRSGPGAEDAHGNLIPLVSYFLRTNGQRGQLVDAFLRYQPAAQRLSQASSARGPRIASR